MQEYLLDFELRPGRKMMLERKYMSSMSNLPCLKNELRACALTPCTP